MVDVTASLATQPPSNKALGKRKAIDDDSDADESEIFAQAQKQRLKDGAALVKQRGKKANVNLKGGGSFQAMGLSPALLRSLLMRGFTTPTPIQRAALPAILASPPRDLVGMARTGSGKTLAYLVPLIQRLNTAHSASFGARALILVPTRELAMQVLLVGKDIARGAKDGQGEPLRWAMIVGGDSLEDQFSLVASNPDIIIATPGRLLHLSVEMNLELKSVEYVVFDEADRLFELGFATQLHEILYRLPTNRQTLLFSATLPKSLVEFAKAGLQNPKLVRLDAESKLSSNLRMAFLSVKPADKEAALLCLLRDVIGVPMGGEGVADDEPERERFDRNNRKRKRTTETGQADEMAAHQTLVFAATKHHVEYLTSLMMAAGYAVSAIYGSLDHTARKLQLSAFRTGRTQILCVTDLAARGIDIPILENVVNYDFPVGARTFIHRVGRTARAGRKGWAYSLVTAADLPHLLDLQLFLSRSLISWTTEAAGKLQSGAGDGPNYSESLVLGGLPRGNLDQEVEHVRTVLIDPSPALVALQGVAERGQRMYDRSSAKASAESYRRAKELGLVLDRSLIPHPIFTIDAPTGDNTANEAEALLARVKAFRPSETVFEIGSRGKTEGAKLMRERRKTLGKIEASNALRNQAKAQDHAEQAADEVIEVGQGDAGDMDEVAEDELQAVFELPKRPKAKTTKSDYRDPEAYLDYAQAGAAEERGYSLNSGTSNFASQAAAASFSLSGGDRSALTTAPPADGDDADLLPQRASALRWDRKTKRVVKGDGTGADNKKLIRTESGVRLPASFQSGRFDAWRSAQRVHLPKIGEAELPRAKAMAPMLGRQYRHKAGVPRADRADDKRGGAGGGKKRGAGGGGPPERKARSSLQRGARAGTAPGGLRTVDQIAKERRMKEKRVKRSTQPSKKPVKGHGRGGEGKGRSGGGGKGKRR